MARYAGTATKVITYQYAYRAHGDGNDARISLCREHANNESAGRPLGAVSHTWHRGRCAVCAQINAATKAGYTRRQAESAEAIIQAEPDWYEARS